MVALGRVVFTDLGVRHLLSLDHTNYLSQ